MNKKRTGIQDLLQVFLSIFNTNMHFFFLGSIPIPL